jgi:hypothetical protein
MKKRHGLSGAAAASCGSFSYHYVLIFG